MSVEGVAFEVQWHPRHMQAQSSTNLAIAARYNFNSATAELVWLFAFVFQFSEGVCLFAYVLLHI